MITGFISIDEIFIINSAAIRTVRLEHENYFLIFF
jgi:hypothetical protein